MKLFCPSCQKELIIEDQYAGQAMKCPMCQAEFTAPALPSYGATASTLPSSSPPPAPPAPPPPGAPGAPSQQYQAGMPPPPPYPQQPAGPPATPYVPPERSTEYTQKASLSLSPFILQWIPVAALVLIFILTFLTWVWIGWGGVAFASQNGWQAAFGSTSVDTSLRGESPIQAEEDRPGVSVLSIFYLLLLFPTIALVIVAAVFGVARIPLPQSLHMLISFRWAIAGGLILLTFFFLTLQLLVGFSLENKMYQEINKKAETAPERAKPMIRGMGYSVVNRGTALSLVFWLHLLAVLVAVYLTVMDMRKTAPIPKVELHW